MEKTPRVNIKDIAAAAGVSPSTASVVLNNKGNEFRISPETREKVLDTARQMGYRQTQRTRQKYSARSKSLWCMFSPTSFDRGPTAQFFAGVNNYLRSNHLPIETVIFPFERGRLCDKADWISRSFTSGAIMTALNDDDMDFIQNTDFDISIVLCNRTARNYYSVSTDEYATGQHAMAHFVKRGHRRFGLISPNYSSRSLSLRIVGFRDRFQSYGFDPDGACIAPIAYGDDSYEGGFAAMKAILDGTERPSAILVLNDIMVAGVLHCIQQNGYSVPGDFEIISNGNTAINTLLFPTITSFSVPTEQMSYDCAKILHNAIENGILSDNVNRIYDAELVFRQSCPE